MSILLPLFPGVHIHVDQRGPVPGSPEAHEVRDSADQDEVSMLDGLHLDIGGHDVLSPITRV